MKKDVIRFLKSHIGNILIISVLGCITYANTIGNAFISDDIEIISENKFISSPVYFLSNPTAILRPFLYFIIVSLWGVYPAPFHVINIFFHIATACSLYALAYLITKKRATSLIGALIFIVHPALSESVSWISGGTYAQYGFFMTLTIIFYILRRKYRAFLWISIGMFVFALLSSQKAAVTPLILLLYELCFDSMKKNWRQIIPFFAMALVYGVLNFLNIGSRIINLETNYYIEGGTFENTLLKIPFAITSYLQLLFFPGRLTLYHSEIMGNTEYIIRIIGLFAFIFLVYYSYKKNKQIFFWLVFFIINLLLVLTPLKVASTIAERYMYYASFGVILATVLFLQQLTAKLKIHMILMFITALIIFVLMFRTFIRNFEWSDEFTFWTATAKTSPNAFSVRNNLGGAYARRNEDEKAVAEFKVAIALNPRYADAYKNLGFVYLKHNDPDTALKYYAKALELNSHNWQFYNDMGAAYIAKQNYKKAEEYFLKALQLSPDNELLYFNLGRIYMMQKENEKAKTAFQNVLRINPNNAVASELLGQVNEESYN